LGLCFCYEIDFGFLHHPLFLLRPNRDDKALLGFLSNVLGSFHRKEYHPLIQSSQTSFRVNWVNQ
jgi:hypothetical protein